MLIFSILGQEIDILIKYNHLNVTGMNKKILCLIIVLLFAFSIMSYAPLHAEEKVDDVGPLIGDLEGPDRLQPPQYYKTLNMVINDSLNSMGPPPVAVSGTRQILVILMNLTNTKANHDPVTHDTAYFWDRFFDPNPPSVRDFYYNNSYGNFYYIAAGSGVYGWYDSTYSSAYWEADGRNVVVEAIGAVDSAFNFAPYDTDTSGTVENDELTIFIIVSGDAGGAFHWWTSGPVATSDGVSVEGEFSGSHEWRHIGGYAHELGHDLGLPDLYDTDDTNGVSEGIGEYGLMGGGSWTFSHMDAWCKIQLGWIAPTIVSSNNYYVVHDAELNAEAFILQNLTYSTTEYFLIENRQPANSFYETVGPPVAPSGTYPDSGIVIYHIDETRMQGWITSGTNNVNADESHKGVDVECADARTSHFLNADDLDKSINRGDANDLWDDTTYDFFDYSTPCNATWSGSFIISGMDIRQIPASASSMTVFLSIEDDTTGPVTSNVYVYPSPTNTNPTVTATVTDDTSPVKAAEFFIDSTGSDGSGTAMAALDGAFDELVEDVNGTIDISLLVDGVHTVYVHGQDALENWGAFDSIVFVVDVTPPVISNILMDPDHGVAGQVFTINADVVDATSGVKSVNASIQHPDETDLAVVTLYDDGAHNDGGAGDGTYGALYDSTGLTPGSYYLDVKAEDFATNVAEVENNIVFLIGVQTATGTGIAYFNSTSGLIDGLTAVNVGTLPQEGRPPLIFPHGLFSFKVIGISPGETVNVTIILPTPMPVNTFYWKYHEPEGWIDATSLLRSNDGDEVLTLRFTDGSWEDDDSTVNSEISELGGPAIGQKPVGGELVPQTINYLTAVPILNYIIIIALISIVSIVWASKKLRL